MILWFLTTKFLKASPSRRFSSRKRKKQTPPHSVFVGYHGKTSAKKSPTRLQRVDATVAVVVTTEGTGRRVKNCLISQGVPGYPPGNYITSLHHSRCGWENHRLNRCRLVSGRCDRSLEGNIVETTHAVSGCTSKWKEGGTWGSKSKMESTKFQKSCQRCWFWDGFKPGCVGKKSGKFGSMEACCWSHAATHGLQKWWPDAPQTTTMKPYSQDTHKTWLRFTPSNLLELRHPRNIHVLPTQEWYDQLYRFRVTNLLSKVKLNNGHNIIPI